MSQRSSAIDRAGFLERIREFCLALPETSERPSHGAPTFFVRGKTSFVTYHDNHHGDGRLAIWCAAPEGLQGMLVGGDPERFFVPPYVGYRGWLGVRLDRGIDWDEIAGIVEDAYLAVAPRRLIEAAGLARPDGEGGARPRQPRRAQRRQRPSGQPPPPSRAP